MTSMLLIGAFTLANGNLWAGTGHQDSIERLRLSSDVLHAIVEAPDKGIPEEVVSNAKCIVVVPHRIKGGLYCRWRARPGYRDLPHSGGLERSCICLDGWG
jgi:lipid-binding SYLF domain-containing protein